MVHLAGLAVGTPRPASSRGNWQVPSKTQPGSLEAGQAASLLLVLLQRCIAPNARIVQEPWESGSRANCYWSNMSLHVCWEEKEKYQSSLASRKIKKLNPAKEKEELRM